MTDRQIAIANELEQMNIGQTVHIDDYEIARITEEIYTVDGERLSFMEVYKRLS